MEYLKKWWDHDGNGAWTLFFIAALIGVAMMGSCWRHAEELEHIEKLAESAVNRITAEAQMKHGFVTATGTEVVKIAESETSSN